MKLVKNCPKDFFQKLVSILGGQNNRSERECCMKAIIPKIYFYYDKYDCNFIEHSYYPNSETIYDIYMIICHGYLILD